MPVSLLPIVIPLFTVILAICFLRRRPKVSILIITGVICAHIAFILYHYVPGWILHVEAKSGNPCSQYKYARWLENHTEPIQNVMIWPVDPDVISGYEWLAKAADKKYPRHYTFKA